ncbi:MAG: peptidylprolyl isomerase [Planctomycetes bacterium]|nr:peptidylprolyl isomerase [Planctomycetota bacterium]
MTRPSPLGILLPAGLAAAALASARAQETRPSGPPPPASLPSGRARLDGVAALVNDDVITESELERVLAAAKETFGFPDPERWKAYRRTKLRDLIVARLYEQAARRRQIPETAIEERVQQRIEEEIRQRGSRGKLFDWIEQQGKTYDDFLKERRSLEFARAFFRQELGLEPGPSGRPSAEIYVRPGGLREYYRAHREEFVVEEAARVRVLLVALPSERWPDRATARERLVEIRGRILGGEEFAALAREFSDVASDKGGEIGWITRGSKYNAEIVSYCLGATGPGVSPVLEWPEGIALVEILEKRAHQVRAFEDRAVQEAIADHLWRERYEEYLLEIRSRLLREAYIWPPDLRLGG